MIKKVISCTIVLFILGTASVFANPETTVGEPIEELTMAETAQLAEEGLQVITPERNLTISKKTMVVELTAQEGIDITVEVYYNASLELDKQKYVLAYDPISMEIGALKRGWAEVELKKGKNKIVVTATYEDGSTETVTRYVDVEELEEVKKKLMEENITDSNKLIKTITGRK
ncbi:hypothetical protein [Alkaliphilus crotonatoxidans]